LPVSFFWTSHEAINLLGSTGSIGCSTLDVVRHNPDRFSVALVAGKNVTVWLNNAWNFPRYAVMDDAQSASCCALREQGSRTEVLSGQQAAARWRRWMRLIR
jgi:1-deoxy-D-xylulose-5-phosphate reductoisomerase